LQQLPQLANWTNAQGRFFEQCMKPWWLPWKAAQ
jgi:hypothetical protein